MAEETHQMLLEHAQKGGDLPTDTRESPKQVAKMLQMIVATKEYLYA